MPNKSTIVFHSNEAGLRACGATVVWQIKRSFQETISQAYLPAWFLGNSFLFVLWSVCFQSLLLGTNHQTKHLAETVAVAGVTPTVPKGSKQTCCRNTAKPYLLVDCQSQKSDGVDGHHDKKSWSDNMIATAYWLGLGTV